jgi:hypothetical protein
MMIFNSILHVVSEKKIFEISANQRRPNGKYVKQTSSQEPLDGLEPFLAEMFLARSLSSVVTFCSDRHPFKMAAVPTFDLNFSQSEAFMVPGSHVG